MLIIYRFLTFVLYPLFIILINLRVILKKEDRTRYKEKIFSSAFNVNRSSNNKLIWFHAASIGETLSILPLIDKINNYNKNIDYLITTVTLSSSTLIKDKIKKNKDINISHRFLPLDIDFLAEKFLNKWKPNMVCFVDSEIWPNFLFKIKVKKIPLVLINGRITEKTFRKWNIFPNFAKKVFANFDLCLACSKTSENILKEFQIKKLLYFGNLKFTAKIKKENLNKSDIKILDTYKVWCAASTHQGEEVFALKTHIEIKKKYKKILTVVVPRHINRVAHIQKLTTQFKLKSQILNENDMIEDNKEILIINSFGTLSKYFNYCKNVFVGKSLIKGLQHTGGQNPIEPAKFGCKVYFGPYVYNFQEVYDFLKNNKMAEQINNEHELSKKIIKNFEEQKGINHQNVSLLDSYGDKILQNTIIELNKLTRIKNENI
jgi:3-deoxy-D-manno-octulosonic-acid transferase|tara:strand:+ start:2631 stop:3926 length:1296 start_codon:yes stop_codon:yes gene_type:complete